MVGHVPPMVITRRFGAFDECIPTEQGSQTHVRLTIVALLVAESGSKGPSHWSLEAEDQSALALAQGHISWGTLPAAKHAQHTVQ